MMKKDELKYFRKGIKDVQRMLGVAKVRLNQGRYTAAEEFMRGEAALLLNLANELRDVIEIQQAEK
ncbi:hypothetical protein L0436_000031 [Salmonella enterica]|uniref:Uncharacterized protein n=1 Tax=Salmonella enterica subsp. enterica serovar Poona TaxID=436295 RepID=A0A5V6NE60_SALET|nr:hypothetical protein [Salmonella enterica]EAA7481395.1 hypothetical protein [Salmonella enterica subsp. enterica serovar Irumu]EAA7723904.1 hypothetical protein [Salmonella enterica subsp. enterica serovar Pomona]EBL6563128.1 hypothetical protein [Salmonella enterica subsp. enterica serovar Muenchen]EBS4388333.1 hypothetical protein [Salmonella enterica subsp. enterica serovar Panama]EBS4763635.1 hypothetical protein [Salmonella enterica subsp. enterica serovar Poona]ECZ7726997.1 hypotheti